MSGPLSGIKVLDFTRLLPGPFGTMVLADLGAEVVRVDAINYPDLVALMQPMDGNVSAAHRALNRTKRSIALNLKDPRGAELVKRVAPCFDVAVEQFRPGVMDRLGVGYEALRAANPRIVYCSITGYGQDGPYRDRAGHDINYLSMAGIASYTGRAGSGPTVPGIQIADQCGGGYNAVIAILAGLIQRERTGEGLSIDISMTDGVMQLGTLFAAIRAAGGHMPGFENELLNGGSYYDFYRTSDGGHMSVGSLEPQFFAALCEALGREDLKEYHMAPGEKGEHLKSELAREFAKKTRDEWAEIFSKVDACVEPVLSVDEARDHPLARARGMTVDLKSPTGAVLRQTGSPYKMDGYWPPEGFAGVDPGTNTAEVLLECGLDDDEIGELKREKVIM